MIILLGFYCKKPGLTAEEFSNHWRDVHGPLFKVPQITQYVRRYVQHHVRIIAPGRNRSMDFDGFSEVWFDSKEDSVSFASEPYFLETIVPDEAMFLDPSRTMVLMRDKQSVQIP